MEDLLYSIAEAVLLEVDEIEEIIYPKNDRDATLSLIVKKTNGKQYELKIKELKNNTAKYTIYKSNEKR